LNCFFFLEKIIWSVVYFLLVIEIWSGPKLSSWISKLDNTCLSWRWRLRRYLQVLLRSNQYDNIIMNRAERYQIAALVRGSVVGSWSLSPCILCLFFWIPEFNLNFVKKTNVPYWIRIFYLSIEYLRPQILFAIASGVGISLLPLM
jgi:hypothetical protein